MGKFCLNQFPLVLNNTNICVNLLICVTIILKSCHKLHLCPIVPDEKKTYVGKSFPDLSKEQTLFSGAYNIRNGVCMKCFLRILLFPVDRNAHEIFKRLQSNAFDAASLFHTNHVVHWNPPREDIFFCVASWLFRITWCSFTTCLTSTRKLTVLFVRHRTVSMTAVYQVKIKYDQEKCGAIF